MPRTSPTPEPGAWRSPGAIGILLTLLLVAGAVRWWQSRTRLEHSQDGPILEAATRYNLDPALVKAVVWKESRFQPLARGRQGEVGLMQLMDPAAQEWAETVRAYPLPERHLFDPRTNTLAGTWYLRKLLQRYRETDNPIPYALADYNAGRGNVLRWARAAAATNSHEFLNQIGFPSTRAYVESVMQRWKHYQRERGLGIYIPQRSPYPARVSDQSKTRVVVGMSGGVDSSTVAALLQQQGYDVVGMTLKLWPQDRSSPTQDQHRGPQGAADARAVCDRLGIPFYLVDEAARFRQHVIQHFAAEYQAGRTPNPCVICNQRIKFGALLDHARQLGAAFLATGHYARVERDETTGRVLLRAGRDPRRDQSYFLFSLSQEQLAHALFPLGDRLKTETRELARTLQLQTADKAESREICFVPDDDYQRFLRESELVPPRPGAIVDGAGRVLGQHQGIAFYTIGQRRGLRVPAARPLYVVDLDPVANRVVVGEASALGRAEFSLERCQWIPFDCPPPRLEVTARIRYNHPGARATVVPDGPSHARVTLHLPQRAVTPGQACVFYQAGLVVGGGWIMRDPPPPSG